MGACSVVTLVLFFAALASCQNYFWDNDEGNPLPLGTDATEAGAWSITPPPGDIFPSKGDQVVAINPFTSSPSTPKSITFGVDPSTVGAPPVTSLRHHLWVKANIEVNTTMNFMNPCQGLVINEYSVEQQGIFLNLIAAGNGVPITFDDSSTVSIDRPFFTSISVDSGEFNFKTKVATEPYPLISLGSPTAELGRPILEFEQIQSTTLDSWDVDIKGGTLKATPATMQIVTSNNAEVIWKIRSLFVDRSGGFDVTHTGDGQVSMEANSCSFTRGVTTLSFGDTMCGQVMVLPDATLFSDNVNTTLTTVTGGGTLRVSSNTITITDEVQNIDLEINDGSIIASTINGGSVAFSGSTGSLQLSGKTSLSSVSMQTGSFTLEGGHIATESYTSSQPSELQIKENARIDLNGTVNRFVSTLQGGSIGLIAPLTATDSITGTGSVYLLAGTFSTTTGIATTLDIVVNGASFVYGSGEPISNKIVLQTGTVTWNGQTTSNIDIMAPENPEDRVEVSGDITVTTLSAGGANVFYSSGTWTITNGTIVGSGDLEIDSTAQIISNGAVTFDVGTGNVFNIKGQGTWMLSELHVSSGTVVIDGPMLQGAGVNSVRISGDGHLEIRNNMHQLSTITISDSGILTFNVAASVTSSALRLDGGEFKAVSTSTKRQMPITSFITDSITWAGGRINTGSFILNIDNLTIEETAVQKELDGIISIKSALDFSSSTTYTLSGALGTNAFVMDIPYTFEAGTYDLEVDVIFNQDVTISQGVTVTLQAVNLVAGNTMIYEGRMNTNTFVINGRFIGRGTLGGDITNSGTLEIGAVGDPPPQVISITGDYAQDGILSLDAGGEVADSIAASGGVFLSGTLVLNLSSNITSDLINIITSGVPSNEPGQFISVIGGAGLRVTYTNGARLAQGCSVLGACGICLEVSCGWCSASDWPDDDRCIDLQFPTNCTDIRREECVPTTSDTRIAAIVVPIVIVLLILIAILVVWFVIRRKAYGVRNILKNKPSHPDFAPIAFGPVICSSRIAKKDLPRVADLSELKDLLLADDLVLADVVADATKSTEQDDIARAMVYTFESEMTSINLIKHFISREVAAAESDSTLFRSNSMASKMLKFYSKLVGLKYLWDTLSDDVYILMETLKADRDDEVSYNVGDQFTFELDPHLKDDWEDIRINKYQLLLTAQKILTRIIRSIDDVPVEFRAICAHLQREIQTRFKDAKYTAIGGFIFLRFFNPAINLPESYGLSRDPPSKEARRVFVLITKTLQSLANGIELGGKEPHMSKLNAFIDDNQDEIRDWFDDIATMPMGTSEDDDFVPTAIPQDVEAICLANIYRHVFLNKNKITKALDEGLRGEIESLVDRIGDPLEIIRDRSNY